LGRRPTIRKLISLGKACEVAFQLRQHSGDNTAHFFDWLTTPAPALAKLIRADFPDFRPENLRLVNKGTRRSSVVDAATGIRFAHQFPRRGKVISESFLVDYPAFASRIAYLASRFRATTLAHPIQFVRRSMSHAEALELEDVMRNRFPSADMRFLYVNAEEAPFQTPLGRSVHLPPPRSGFGDSIAWAGMLQREGLVEAPFRLATAEIVRSSSNNHHLGEHDRHSVDALREARRRNPENPWFAHELGWKEFTRFRYGRAARLARAALAHEPDNPDFIELKLRADVSRLRIRREAALRQALLVVERTSHPGLWDLSANLMLALGRPSEALDHIERALALRPYTDELQLKRGKALFAAGRLEEAESAADEALALRPQGKSYVELKARILCALGRADEAYALLCDVLRSRRSYRLQILRARLALGAGPRRGRLRQAAPVAPLSSHDLARRRSVASEPARH
jgi:tetratricopeptide (TPR) repeat protein